MQNGLVDRDFMASAPHHFNNEAFAEGRNLIIQGTAAIKANVRTDNLQSARETLGRVCHTLQVGEREIQSVTMTSILLQNFSRTWFHSLTVC